MKLQAIAAAVLALATAGANALIVNIDATTATGTDVTLAAGSYTLDWAGIAGGGLYDAWTYNTATSGNYRNAFSASVGSTVLTIDRNDGSTMFNQYATAAAALADFRGASGAAAFQIYGTTSDNAPIGTYAGPVAFTLAAPTSVHFSVPDHILGDNTGGVSLAITAAVPEPETYALMLAGLAAVGFVARRRSRRAD